MLVLLVFLVFLARSGTNIGVVDAAARACQSVRI